MAIGSDNLGVLLKIKADSDQASAEFKKFRKEFKETEDAIKKSGGVMETALLGFAQGIGLSGKETAALKANLLDLGKIAGAAAVGVGAIATVAVGVGAALYGLAKQASDYGSAIFDASERTGLGAETISALKVAAEQSGSSFENITSAVAKFSSLVGQAAEGSKKAQKVLERYGIEPVDAVNDLQGALEKAFTVISSLETPSQKAAAAAALFKDRTGEILPVINAANGDLQAFREECKRLGLTITDETAKAADELGDQMDTLGRQFESVKIKLGNELIPVFIDATSQISEWLVRNKGEVASWSKAVSSGLHNAFIDIQTELNDLGALTDFFDSLFAGDTWDQLFRKWDRRRLEATRITVARQNVGRPFGNVNDQPDDLRANLPTPTRVGVQESEGDRRAREKAQKEAERAAKKAQEERDRILEKQRQGQLGQLNALQAAEKHLVEQQTKILKQQLETRFLTSKEYLERRLTIEEDFAKRSIENADREFDLKLKQGGLEAEQQLALEKENENERQKIVDERYDREEEAKKEAADFDKKATEEQLRDKKDAMERSIAFSEAEAQKKIAVLERLASEERASAEQVAKFKELVEENLLNERIGLLKKYLGLLTPGSKEYLNVENQIKILEENLETVRAKNAVNQHERQQQANDDLQEYYDELDRVQKLEIQRALDEEARKRKADRERVEATDPTQSGILGGIFGELPHVGIPDLFGGEDQMLEDAEFVKEVWGGVFDVIGGGIGQMVQGLAQMAAAWLSTGKFSAKAALQMASSIALSLAMQAGVAAIMELARGWAESAAAAASLAVGDVRGAALHTAAAGMHFSAAAIYGTVAGVAAAVGIGTGLAARAFGNESNQATGGASSPSSNSGRNRNTEGQGQAYSPFGDDAQIRNASINQPGLVLTINDRSDWFEKMFELSIDRNTRLRDSIRRVAEA